jgi:hypothetical protein
MRKVLHTSIDMNASAEAIWAVLTNFDDYPQWNPFIREIKGQISVGKRFEVRMEAPQSKPMTFKPTCLTFVENKTFSWLGHFLIPGIFDGEHIFELQGLENGKTRFTQKENFKGILVKAFSKQLDTNTKKGFQMMNEALKKVVEA